MRPCCALVLLDSHTVRAVRASGALVHLVSGNSMQPHFQVAVNRQVDLTFVNVQVSIITYIVPLSCIITVKDTLILYLDVFRTLNPP